MTSDDRNTRAIRTGLSFVAIAVGWGVGLLYYIACGLASRPINWLGDFFPVAAWTGLFTVAGWLLCFVPLIFAAGPRSRLYRFSVFPIVGALLGTLAFAVLVAWWAPLWEHWFYAIYPAVIGSSAALAFVWLQHRYVHARTGMSR